MKKDSTYKDKKIYFWVIFIVLIGAINYGIIGSFDIDLIKYGADTIHPLAHKIAYIIFILNIAIIFVLFSLYFDPSIGSL